MNRQRWLIIAAILCMSGAYLLPLWKITLEAPQYPEPIGFSIYINTIRGIGEHDLENINILNHYIGMKPIVPDNIPELRIMSWILFGLIAFGIIVAIHPHRILLGLWISVTVLAGCIGVYDFDQWEREYGSNLDPNAPIKIEGMTYKPPLIGSEKLLNITAHSYPSFGGYGILISVILGIVALFIKQKKGMHTDQEKAVQTASASIGIAGIVLYIGCTPSPEPIRYGLDQCAYCAMTITDQRFGSEIVTKTGKVYKFDSIECLVGFKREAPDSNSFALEVVTDFLHPGKLINAQSAAYVRSDQIQSPMGANVSAYSSVNSADSLRSRVGGKILSWNEVVSTVSIP